MSPKVLENNNIPVQKCVQQPGEFIITFPFGYHSGYNLDFNCAESVNFALDSWIEIGKKAKSCACIEDAVRIDVEGLLDSNATHKRELEEEETSSRKRRKSPSKDPCVLCGKVALDQPTLVSNCGKYHNIHPLCAEAVNETYIQNELVYGVDDIPASRWKLVCLFCKEKNTGACMQCCYGKCWKSFHPTCAVTHHATMNKTTPTESDPSAMSLYDGYCPQHDPVSESACLSSAYILNLNSIRKKSVKRKRYNPLI